jgi:hypothetical protein
LFIGWGGKGSGRVAGAEDIPAPALRLMDIGWRFPVAAAAADDPGRFWTASTTGNAPIRSKYHDIRIERYGFGEAREKITESAIYRKISHVQGQNA